jgi:hypothetical protein
MFLNVEDDKLINGGKINGKSILRRTIVDADLLRKVIEVINIDNENIKVSLVNGSTFNIDRKNNFI